MLHDPVHAAAARAAAQAGAQLVQVLVVPGSNQLYIAVFGVAHPSTQLKLAGLATNKPAKPNPLHTTLNEKVKNHIDQLTASFADAQATAQAGESENAMAALDRSQGT